MTTRLFIMTIDDFEMRKRKFRLANRDPKM